MSIDRLLLRGEQVHEEVRRVNAQLPAVRGTKPGTLYLTDRRLIFRSKVLFNETVYDVPYSRIADVSSQSNGISAGRIVITTTGGDTLRLRVQYNMAAPIVSAIRGLSQLAPGPESLVDRQDVPPSW